MSKAVPRNAPCPCGSGKKYKDCCLEKDKQTRYADQIECVVTPAVGRKARRRVASLDSIPTHNTRSLTPAISPEAMMALAADEIHRILKKERVGMLGDLVNRVVEEMNIVPAFTYRQIGEWLNGDDRFTGLQLQIYCLAGDDPLELMADRF